MTQAAFDGYKAVQKQEMVILEQEIEGGVVCIHTESRRMCCD